ncbi:glutamate-5-semialdehyde dehydrogenase [Flavihumibacter rivuli]|uniref:glutamate-5-semialdehyde dehydrogenase n=1 Tax=Flavihumibacter rivuli TaxID=2838156 RepID=UPI001BDEB549|nr:glutamate-5-semialdehyde dehydrogenase [Flavihumibacter rivuli]ULQ56982.1 glutamate-5-semialdehyde dehydrogenase [Flavihumibacter rivuli]
MKSVLPLIKKTHQAATSLQLLTDKQVRQALKGIATAMEAEAKGLLKANAMDLAKQDPNNPRNDRLLLNEQRIKAIANSLRKVAQLPDPTGRVLEKRTIEKGLKLEKISTPLGVVGAIYESRPNVTFDIAGLCLRSRNACLLKGSSEAEHTNSFSVKLIKKQLKAQGIDPEVVNLLPSAREVVDQLFTATKYIDVIIPRGSAGLIEYVRKNSLVPVIETGAGVCHVYVEKKANLEKAVAIAVNAKTSRPSVCNAVDTLLVDQSIAKVFLPMLLAGLAPYEVEIFADAGASPLMKGYPFLKKARAADFGREFLSLKCAIRLVRNMDEALAHIAEYSTKHSEAIVSEDKKACERFLKTVDAAAVYANASTRFTDGEVFGLGAEIGISTQKLHARGPFALEKLVTEKWVIRGNGQTR